MKYINLNMDRVQYEGHDYQSYSLPADRVNAVLNTENVPEITLSEPNSDKPVVATIFVLIRTIISVGRKENTIQSIVALLVCIAGTIVYYVTFAPANMSL